MNKPIDQKSVDQVAQFVEVCSELENEPFFGKDEQLTFRGAEDRWTFTFGDRFQGMRASWGIDGSRIDVYEDCIVITDEKAAKALDFALKIFREQFLKD